MDAVGTWIIQRCTQRWIGSELQYEDFPTKEGVMTRDLIMQVLERVCRENPEDEFRGHNLIQLLKESSN